MHWDNLTTHLEGSIVTLEPLDQRNAEELWGPAQPEEIWDWLANLNRRDRFDLWLELTFAAAKDGLEGPFLTRSAADGEAIGSSRYLNVRPADRVVEIGWTWLNPRAWRTGANVEAKLLCSNTPSRPSNASGSSSRPTLATTARGLRSPQSPPNSRGSCEIT
jgi:hypothetical protein